MRKVFTLLLTFVFVLNLLNSTAQTKKNRDTDDPILFEKFETWPPEGWTFSQVEGSKGFVANTGEKFDEQNACHSYDKVDCNDWMVSKAISVESAYALSVMCKSNYPNDIVVQDICISKGSNDVASGDFEIVHSYNDKSNSDWTEVLIDLAPYTGETIYVGFNYQGNYKSVWRIDNFKVYKKTEYDIAINSFETGGFILAGKKGKFITTVENLGANEATDATLTISGLESGDLTETFTVASGKSTTIELKFDATTGEKELTATVALANDAEEENNTKSLSIRPVEDPMYGYLISASVDDSRTKNFIVFDANAPQYIYSYSNEDRELTKGMAYVGHTLYVASCEFKELTSSTGQKKTLAQGLSFGTMDFETGEYTKISDVTVTVESMAYNPVDKKLYAIGYDDEDIENNYRTRNLYTIDRETGVFTKIPAKESLVPPSINTFAIDNNGKAYGIDCESFNDADRGRLHIINLEDFSYSIGGHTGLSPRGDQSMLFDFNTNKIVWPFIVDYASSSVSGLYNVDETNSQVTKLGDSFPGHIVGLSKPFDKAPDPTLGLKEGFNAWPLQGWTIVKEGDETASRWHENDEIMFEGNSCAFYEANDKKDNVNAVSYLISPPITVPEKGKLMFYEMNKYMKEYTKHEVLISKGSGNPEDGEFEVLKELKDKALFWTERIIDLKDYVGEDVYIAFKYTGDMSTNWGIDFFNVYEEKENELRVTYLNSPPGLVGENNDVVIKPIISNRGYGDIKDATAVLKIDEKTFTKKFDVKAHEDVYVTFEPWKATLGTHTVSLTISTENEDNVDNNTAAAAFFVTTNIPKNVVGYAVGSLENTVPAGPLSFNVFDPQNLKSLEHKSKDGKLPLSGALINHLWFCNYIKVTAYDDGTVKTEPHSWEIIDTETGETINSGVSDKIFTEMSYDYTTNTLYGIADNKTGLYTIDPVSGEYELVKHNPAATTIGFAIDKEGVAYAICDDGQFYIIDLASHHFIRMGYTYVEANGLAQCMAYDHATDRLFWITPEGYIYTVDKSHGKATFIHMTKGATQVTAFDIPHGESKHYVNFTAVKDGKPLKNLPITIKGITKNTNDNGQIAFMPYDLNEEITYRYKHNDNNQSATVKMTKNQNVEIIITDLDELSKKNIDIYPNPSNGIVNIVNIGNAIVKVVDIHGKVVLSKTSNTANLQLDLSGLENGVYFLQSTIDGELLNSKIVINK
ncbi:MAG: choice-of-anchor J domain-containing protein [Hyphomicrobiales bacterium]